MSVPCQGHEPRAGLLRAGIEPVPRRREPVPGVEVKREAELAERDQLLDIANILRGFLLVCQRLGEIRGPDPSQNDLIGKHLPGFVLCRGVTKT